ncbi:four helix bundle protein [Chryseolinea sp. T2]|uniref:four helix bundle protein n=1 Tax=Chryseolinea sp. T2 TaxID=3129255 RepID=UPI0030789EDE
MRDNVVKIKSFQFAVIVAGCCRELIESREYVLSRQLLRSGTSIGANVREAINASSRKDFAYKLGVALRESDETLYWLELLFASNYIVEAKFKLLHEKAEELIRILTSILKTTRQTLR